MLSLSEMSALDLRAIVSSLTTRDALLYGASAWTVYKVLQALYNISPLHPLSKVPGPKLAGATYWPEFYHDVILFGRYTHEIERMHQKYGKVSSCRLFAPALPVRKGSDRNNRPYHSYQSQRDALQ